MNENRSSFLQGYELPDYPSRIFHQLDGWECFKDLGEPISIPANMDIVKAGDTVHYCYLVIHGRVVSMEYTADGSERLFNFFEDGSIFLESNLLFDAPAAVFFHTMRPSKLVCISLDRLYDAMGENPQIALFLLRSMSYKYYSAMDQIRENYNHDATWKVLNLFQLMAINFGTARGDWVSIDIQASQQMIGNMLGINRITIGKALKELADMDIVMRVNNTYWIRNSKTIQLHMKQFSDK